jgi:hypothetical protein
LLVDRAKIKSIPQVIISSDCPILPDGKFLCPP